MAHPGLNSKTLHIFITLLIDPHKLYGKAHGDFRTHSTEEGMLVKKEHYSGLSSIKPDKL